MGSLDGEVTGLEPQHGTAQEPRAVAQLLQAGIVAAKAGQRDQARDC